MAASSPETRRGRSAVALLCVPAALLALGMAPVALGQLQEITLDAASSDFDRRNERLVFREVRISQGDMSVSANEAETRDLDFSRGTWVFRGNVRIESDAGTILSDRATVSFANHRLQSARAEGSPARFSRLMLEPERRLVTGNANRIDYDLARGELELSGQASLSDGLREVSGGRLLYRIREDRLLASADEEGTERVRIVITPPERPDGGARPDGEEAPDGETLPEVEERDEDEEPTP
jgi:lipopolysaccharide transport protein LptA